MTKTKTIDIESLSQYDYVDQTLTSEGLGYCSKTQFIADYQASTMDTFIGTKAQCDALFETTKNAGELRFKDRAKKINIRRGELLTKWFDHHTDGLSDIEKTFVKRLINHLDMDVKEAIDRLEEFADLLKVD